MTVTERERLMCETRYRILRAQRRNQLEDGLRQMSHEQLMGTLMRMSDNGERDPGLTVTYLTWIRLQGRA